MTTRTEAIHKAIVAELRRRQPFIDAHDSLVSVSITVRLQAGPNPIRAVTYEDQSQVGGRRSTD